MKIVRQPVKIGIENGFGAIDEYETTLDMRDTRAWERYAAQRDLPPQLDKMTQLAMTYAAWHALYRTKTYTGTFDEFESSCVAIEPVGDPAEVNPTIPAPPAMPSPPSL